ncbi:endonuclease 8-like 1 [Bolinopsis microptera]|uniref:endonuclease 8-like 1 n=1 Tax=Bolinopsis microptera TaxID=2820187 RepID=UPI003078C9CA
MPEGPELYKAATFLNHIASQHIFKKVRPLKEPSHKHPLIPWTKPSFSLAGEARGKEIRITFTELSLKDEVKNDKFFPETLNILLTFGMAGRFAMTKTGETRKHSLLMFDTTDDQTFSFVDTRHFGRWILTDEWSPQTKRGPSIITEYQLFRKYLLSLLDKPVFDKPICEVMLDQRYFSSIGNYLRAEILYRLDIDPYCSARSVLENLPEVSCDNNPDLLRMCHDVCWEVINLKGSGKPYDPEGIYGDHGVFEAWLQCYMVNGMGNSVDKKGRTMWHSLKFGKGKHSRHTVKPVKSEENDSLEEDTKPKRNSRSRKVKSEPLEKTESEYFDKETKPRRSCRSKNIECYPSENGIQSEGVDVKTESEYFDKETKPKNTPRSKKVKSEPLDKSETTEGANAKREEAEVKIKTEPQEVMNSVITEGGKVKIEPYEVVSNDINIKLEQDEEFDGSVIRRRSVRLKRAVNQGNSGDISNKSKRIKDTDPTYSPYFK